jgi:hypothetical protein
MYIDTPAPQPPCSNSSNPGMGDLSFDGTGLFGSGLFGYSPWYDTSQWTGAEWAAVAVGGYVALELWAMLKGGKRGRK